MEQSGSGARLDASTLAAPLQSAIKRLAAARAFIGTIFLTPETMLIPSGDTIVCRREEVTAAQTAEANACEASGLRHLRVQTRVGMGLAVLKCAQWQLLIRRPSTAPESFSVRCFCKPSTSRDENCSPHTLRSNGS